ncbi:MAG: MmcQ/YjbR family DNA-binding protein [Bryobacteraceae bacterium]
MAAAKFEAVRALAYEFPDLQESTMYGSPALKVGKRLVACLAIHRSAEPGSLVVRTDFEQRAALLADDPATFYVTDHYARHPVVLVRMRRLQRDQLRELLAAARQCVLTHADQKKARRREKAQRREKDRL